MTVVKNATGTPVDLEATGQILAPDETSRSVTLTPRDQALVTAGVLVIPDAKKKETSS